MEEGARSQYACLDADTLSASAITQRSLQMESWTTLGLRQDERALQHGLRVQRQAFGSPWGPEVIKLHRIGNVGFQLGGMTGDGFIARVSNVGMGSVCLLKHRASEAREVGNVTDQDRLAKIEIAEDAIERISV